MLEAGYVGSNGINLLDYNHNVNTARLASASGPNQRTHHHDGGQRRFSRPLCGLRPGGPASDGLRRDFELQQLCKSPFAKQLPMA